MIAVGGMVPFSTVDYPGKLSAVVFCQGCPWRCRYCHNPHLLEPDAATLSASWAPIRAFLERRKGLLDGVVFSGGEPLAQRRLYEAMREIREQGFLSALHTGGAYPERLGALLDAELLDWVGLDIKADVAGYAAITGVEGSGERAYQCLDRLLDAGIAFECRTSIHGRLHDPDRLLTFAGDLADRGVRRYSLQMVRHEHALDQNLGDNRLKTAELRQRLSEILAPRFEHFEWRE